MTKDQASQRDKILSYLNDVKKSKSPIANIRMISNNTEIENYLVKTILHELRSDGLVNILNEGSDLLDDGDILEISSRGQAFLIHDGGFSAIAQAYRRSRIEANAKTALKIIHTILTISIAFWAAWLTSKSSINEDELEELDSRITELEKPTAVVTDTIKDSVNTSL